MFVRSASRHVLLIVAAPNPSVLRLKMQPRDATDSLAVRFAGLLRLWPLARAIGGQDETEVAATLSPVHHRLPPQTCPPIRLSSNSTA